MFNSNLNLILLEQKYIFSGLVKVIKEVWFIWPQGKCIFLFYFKSYLILDFTINILSYGRSYKGS